MVIETNINNQIATVTLNRPEVHNALNPEMITGLTKMFESFSDDKNIRAVVLSGNGKSFCAGGDLNRMKSMIDSSLDENVQDALNLGKMLKVIYSCSKPVIGKVHGNVFGGGVGLVSVCDIVVALEETTFCLSEVKLGLLPAVISPFLLKKISFSYASRYSLTAEAFKAPVACKIGLVSEIAPTEAVLNDLVSKLSGMICKNGPEAVSLCKKHIQDINNLNIHDAVNKAAELLAKRRVSNEGQEGMKAFFEKRLPSWVK